MSKPLIHRSVRFDPDQYAALEAMAAKEERTFADFLRIAIERYLKNQNLLDESQLRQARLAEFTQAALDVIIREDHDDLRVAVIAETNRRMERYHGAR